MGKVRMKRMTIIGAVFAVCCAAVVPAVGAMPTQEELDKADALVQEVMKAETEALRSGKKTREQVGDAAVAEDAERVNHGIHRIHGKRR